MPHDKNGTPLKVGDVVRGKGYNVKDGAGNLKEITGHITHIDPSSTACNIQVLHAIVPAIANESGFLDGAVIIGGKPFYAQVEYGRCDHFEKVG